MYCNIDDNWARRRVKAQFDLPYRRVLDPTGFKKPDFPAVVLADRLSPHVSGPRGHSECGILKIKGIDPAV